MGSAQDPRSMNRFLYAHANPATLIDPTGHGACTRWIDDICQKAGAAHPVPSEPPTSDEDIEKDYIENAKQPGSGAGNTAPPTATPTPVAVTPAPRDCGFLGLGCWQPPGLNCRFITTPVGQEFVCDGGPSGGGDTPVRPPGEVQAGPGQNYDPLEIARQIAEGHARDRMWKFGFSEVGDLAKLIEGIIVNHDDYKRDGDKEYFWDDESDSIVIIDPNGPDGGTIIRPSDGKDYFDRQPGVRP
jgi:hypothetical protein